MSEQDFASVLASTEGLTEDFKNQAVKIFNEAVQAKVDAKEKELAEHAAKTIEDLVEKKCGEVKEATEKECAEKAATTIQTLKDQHEQDLDDCKKECAEQAAEKLHEALTEQFDQSIASFKDRLASYVDYVAEQYVADHKEAIVESHRASTANEILESIKSVFAQYGVAPVEGSEGLTEKLADVEADRDQAYANLAEAVEAKFAVEKELNELKKQTAFSQITESLTDADKARVSKLVDCEDSCSLDQFKDRVNAIIESVVDHDKSAETLTESITNVVTDKAPEQPVEAPVAKSLNEDVDPEVAYFANILNSSKEVRF